MDSLLLVKDCCKFYFWIRKSKHLKIKRPPKLTPVEGQWFVIDPASDISLPLICNEAVLDQQLYTQVINAINVCFVFIMIGSNSSY